MNPVSSEAAISLPGPYEPVVLDRVDSARAHAERLASEGAEEGTLVWAKSQREGLGRSGNYWMSGARNLHCAIILRPGDELETCGQISLVACISAAMAIARQAEPLEELRYGWPNDVLLNRGKVAGVTLSGQLDALDRVAWMVVGLNVNTYEHPSSKGFDAASMRGEGFSQYARTALLEAYAREFLSWINRWANEGCEPVKRAWLTRGSEPGGRVTVNVDDITLSGAFIGLDPRGGLQLRDDDGRERNISLGRFFRPDFLAPD